MTNDPSANDNTQAQLIAAQRHIQQLHHEIKAMRQRNHDLFESAGDSIFIMDENGIIVDANEHASRRLGYARDELLGQSIHDIEVNDTNDDAAVSWVSSFSDTHVYECHYRHRSGSLIPVEVSSRIINWGGQIYSQHYVRNISLRKQMEQEREQLISDLDSFAHTVAHDLKNPLSILLGYAELILDPIAEPLTPQDIHQYVTAIRDNTRRTINIIEELLLFASVRRQAQVEPSLLDMAEIVAQAQARLTNLSRRHDATIVLPDMWYAAMGYAPWVQEVWVNYISNAIKYGGNPPIITLSSQPSDDGRYISYSVRDNGQGIAPDKIPNLFGQFERLEVEHVEGHGLGLSIVKRIVERLGGDVTVQSVVGKGSIFSFSLPRP